MRLIDGLNEALALVGIGPAIRLDRLAGGHIHGTWSVRTATGRVVAQALNADVFTNLDDCEQNLRRISEHLGARNGISVPRLLYGIDGRCHVSDTSGRIWRLTDYVVGTRAGSVVRSASVAWRAADAFGRYACALTDLPGPPLHVTIDCFHDLAGRLEQLDAAVFADKVGRVARCKLDLDRIRSLATSVISALAGLPSQPVRPVHNDAKVGNLRFGGSGKIVVLDLDTTMPGAVIFDVGELLRTATHNNLEDAAGQGRARLDRERVDAVIEGFVHGMAGLLTPPELAALRPAAPLMAVENAVRMLADHLDGDRYFGADYPDQNLHRACAQATIAAELCTIG